MSGTPLAEGHSGWCACMSLLQESHPLHAVIRHILHFFVLLPSLAIPGLCCFLHAAHTENLCCAMCSNLCTFSMLHSGKRDPCKASCLPNPSKISRARQSSAADHDCESSCRSVLMSCSDERHHCARPPHPFSSCHAPFTL